MKKFNEFLKEKAKIGQVADYDGPLATKPPENAKYPNTPKGGGTKLPYRGKGEDPGLQSADTDSKTPLCCEPHPGMSPEKVMPQGKAPAKHVKHLPLPKKLREFYENTRDLSDSEFVAYLLERNNERPSTAFVHDLHGEPFTPHPHETMTYIASLLHNPKMVCRLVREVKRQGRLGEVVSELMDHPEFYKEAVNHMDHEEEGPKVAGKFARAMHDHASDFRRKAGINEAVAPELADDFSDDDDASDVLPQKVGPNTGQEPEGEAEMPEPPQGDMGVNMGGGNPGGPKAFPHNHMIGSMVPFFRNDMEKACADGNC